MYKYMNISLYIIFIHNSLLKILQNMPIKNHRLYEKICSPLKKILDPSLVCVCVSVCLCLNAGLTAVRIDLIFDMHTLIWSDCAIGYIILTSNPSFPPKPPKN